MLTPAIDQSQGAALARTGAVLPSGFRAISCGPSRVHKTRMTDPSAARSGMNPCGNSDRPTKGKTEARTASARTHRVKTPVFTMP